MSKAPQLSGFKQPFICRFSFYHYITQQTITAGVRSFPVKSVIFCTREAALFWPRKFFCAVSCTRLGPSQLSTIDITVALAVPLRSYFHYTRCCTNTGGKWDWVLPKEPKWDKLQTVTFFVTLFFF